MTPEIEEAIEYAESKQELLGLHSVHVLLWALARAVRRQEKELNEAKEERNHNQNAAQQAEARAEKMEARLRHEVYQAWLDAGNMVYDSGWNDVRETGSLRDHSQRLKDILWRNASSVRAPAPAQAGEKPNE